MISGLFYLYPTSDYFYGATPTFAGTADPAYPVTNVGNGDPQNPFITADTTGDIALDLGSAKSVRFLSIIHCGLAAGLAGVKFQGSNSNTFSPLVFDQTITIPAYGEDGQPTNAHIDLADSVGVQTVRYIRLHIGTANTGGISIGELCSAATWQSVAFKQGSTSEDESHPNIRNVSEGGGVPTIYEHGYRMRWLRGTLVVDSRTDSTDTIRRWLRAARDDSRPFLIHPHLSIDEPWYVRFEKDNTPKKRLFQTSGLYVDEYTVGFEEAQRGLPPE